jgi:carboxyl-terminal processing protease
MTTARALLVCILAVILGACSGLGKVPGPEAQAAADQLAAQARAQAPLEVTRFRLFAQVFDQVRTNYVKSVDDEALLSAAAAGMRDAYPDPAKVPVAKLVTAAIDGMLGTLDPYSAYLDRRSFVAVRDQTRGRFGGIGLQVTKEDNTITVISPIDGTPAAEAGMRPGDRITHADGKPLGGLSLRAAVLQLRGLAGTRVRLTILRDDKAPFDVAIVRALIEIKAVRWALEDDIGYIRITTFNARAADEFAHAVNAIRAKAGSALAGFVLDLRNNPGGLLDQSILISDLLLEKGEIVLTRGRLYQRHFRARPGDITSGLPIVILINEGSASAAEIVAGALQDHGRATLVGVRTFGKGSVQTIIPFGESAALKLTTATFYTPSGRSVSGGIAPDIKVLQDDERAGDEQRQRAFIELGRMAGR